MRQIVRYRASALALAAAFSLSVSAVTRADDDIKLKDGTKITGVIVGFEENSFKVKTSYGFALVQKDQVASIVVASGSNPPGDKAATPDAKSVETDKPKPDAVAAKTTATQPASPAGKPLSSTKPASPTAAATSQAAVTVKAPPTPTVPASATVDSPALVAANGAPPKPSAPEPIREQVTGTTYTNETYRFHMYKPPDWDVIASAPAVLPGAITAMGTPDDSTYLLIGQAAAGKSLASDMDATEQRLRGVMENFRSVHAEQITISGATAMEHRFRGNVDQHEWSGIVVLVARGPKLYTIFGMTRADNDLVQLEENVISRAISSLQFTN